MAYGHDFISVSIVGPGFEDAVPVYVKIARGRKSKGDLLDEAIEVVKKVVGEGVGISAAILAMAKRLSWNDWLLFSEKCGMPVILGNTGAKEDTPAWKNLLNAIANVAPKTGVLAAHEVQESAGNIGDALRKHVGRQGCPLKGKEMKSSAERLSYRDGIELG